MGPRPLCWGMAAAAAQRLPVVPPELPQALTLTGGSPVWRVAWATWGHAVFTLWEESGENELKWAAPGRVTHMLYACLLPAGVWDVLRR